MQPGSNLLAKQYYIIHHIWDKDRTESGLYTGETYYEEWENPPGWLYPTSGIVIKAPKKSPVQPGDKLFFTWNGFDYNNCISPKHQDNIYAVTNGVFAYERAGVIKGITYLLLEKIITPQEATVAESGLILSGYIISGSVAAPK